MVDIGGEVVVKGKNPSKGLWRIGINKPIDDSLAINQDLQTILEITDLAWLLPETIVIIIIRMGRNTPYD